MAFPRGRLTWYPLPGGRAHVVVTSTTSGMPLVCGVTTPGWLVDAPQDFTADVMLTSIRECDHAGTRNEPRSAWTGERAPL